ncbi:anti-sigma F factor antagonist [Diplocloster agilis]|uniref:Anti-sigma F factor antagonist n=1 Tax=Diplocloster agilis TaxID=2850323 RepID=A0A949K865_9FIRM|nr:MULTISPECIES: anti-sigma F factor antagonist [Lachnospiraceae]MBU9737872.1 anti-sigma F factor antagonist [Diplocloster agilis]MBU9744605.1 anti-sigma F factor antagonist [Diplocloster agilis]MCU6735312.1 anti-sigma F factor antagonist [Suonthocola fibrivorans]SCJ70679.1 Stage II sporulation protein AA [uncultured Clostridium sp.]
MSPLFQLDHTSLIIHVPAELDHHNAEEIRKGADDMMEKQNVRSIVFDFSNTNFMDSSGIGVIMGRYKNLNFTGGKVLAVSVSPRIRRILTLSGIHKIIDIYDDFPQETKTV